MKTLGPPDSFYLRGAQSCLESGDHLAAETELGRIESSLRSHPDVLELQWAVQARGKQWQLCLETARAIVSVAPERPTGWIKYSFVLHRLKRTQEALNNLFRASEKFSDLAEIPYNLACYAAQLDHFWEAERWLKQALEVGGRQYQTMALADPDLEPLWEKIRQL